MDSAKIEELQLPNRFYTKLQKDITYLINYPGIQIQKIILFGSCARGTYKITSDIDLLLVTKDSLTRDVRGEIASELEEPVDYVKTDIVFYSEMIFRNSDSLLMKQVKKDGIIIYNHEEERM